jgi:hypothetical protein
MPYGMKHLTVVYTVTDESKFADGLAAVMDQFADVDGKPWSITAVTMDNEIRRVQLIEQAIANADLIAATTVLTHIDIGNVESLEELSN